MQDSTDSQNTDHNVSSILTIEQNDKIYAALINDFSDAEINFVSLADLDVDTLLHLKSGSKPPFQAKITSKHEISEFNYLYVCKVIAL